MPAALDEPWHDMHFRDAFLGCAVPVLTLSGFNMTRHKSWVIGILLCPLAGALACSGTEPGDGLVPLPELVYTELDIAGDLWSIRGYTEGEGSREIAPGPSGVPRPVHDFLIVRPTTGELLYVSGLPDNPDITGYVLLNPATGTFSRPDIPGSVQDWSPAGDLLTTYFGGIHMVVTVEGATRATVCEPSGYTCGAPHWAPDGNAILVHRRPPGGQADLWRVPLDGSPPINLTQTPDASEIGPSYSPDGRLIAYERQPNWELVVAQADGSEPRPLIAPVGLGNFPWSPDGLSIAVDASVGGQSGLVVVPTEGDPRVITPPGETLVIVSEIAWAPDGRRLAYGAFHGAASDLTGVFLINVDGSGWRQVSTPGNQASLGTWMPDLP